MGVGIIPIPSKTTARAKRRVKRGLSHNWCAHRSPALPPAGAVFLKARDCSGRFPYQEETTKTSPAGAIAPSPARARGLRAPLPLRATGGRKLMFVGSERLSLALYIFRPPV